MKSSIKRKAGIAAGVIFVIAVAALYIYLYLLPDISGALTPTYIVNYGRLQTSFEEPCLFVRDESLVYAANSGSISYYSGESEKTRKGTKVLDIYPAGGTGKSYYASSTGFISYYIDGYEEYYTLDTVRSLQAQTLLDFTDTTQNTFREQASSGEVLYKLIKNNIWYIVLITDSEGVEERYKLSSVVSIDIDGFVTDATVSEILMKEEKAFVILKISTFFEDFAKFRHRNINVITEDYEGLIIPNSAIAADEEEKPGVYVKGINGDYTFKPITIIVAGETESLVKTGESLKIYDEILKDSQDVNSR